MQFETTDNVGYMRRGKVESVESVDGNDDIHPFVNSSELRALVVKEFKQIEKLEEQVAELRTDIKGVVKRLVDKGLNKRAVQMALARRKLVVKGGLERVDESLALICGIGSLGIQGELFGEHADEARPEREDIRSD